MFWPASSFLVLRQWAIRHHTMAGTRLHFWQPKVNPPHNPPSHSFIVYLWGSDNGFSGWLMSLVPRKIAEQETNPYSAQHSGDRQLMPLLTYKSQTTQQKTSICFIFFILAVYLLIFSPPKVTQVGLVGPFIVVVDWCRFWNKRRRGRPPPVTTVDTH